MIFENQITSTANILRNLKKTSAKQTISRRSQHVMYNLLGYVPSDEKLEMEKNLIHTPMTNDTSPKMMSSEPKIHQIDVDDLQTCRWFFYDVDQNLTSDFINTLGFGDILYWDRIIGDDKIAWEYKLNSDGVSLWKKVKNARACRAWEYKWIVDLLINRKENGGKCIDIGTGLNLPLPYLLTGYFDTIEAVDIDERVLNNAKDSKINFRVLDATHLPYEDESFENVFCISVLEHLKLGTINKAVSEIYRVLKLNGVAVITLDIGSERKSWPNQWNYNDIYKHRNIAFYHSLFSHEGFELKLDPCGQGQFNDSHRKHRVSMSGYLSPRGFATYRLYAKKVGN